MSLGIRTIEIMTVVGRHQGQRQLLADFHQSSVGGCLLRDAVFHDFQIEIIRSKKVAVLGGGPKRGVHILSDDVGGYFPVEAGTQADEPLVMGGEQFFVDPGPVVVTFPVAVRG